MKPLSVPMKTVIRVLARKQNPMDWYPYSQLRLIYAGLERRGLVRYTEQTIANPFQSVVLTPAGRNLVTEMQREREGNGSKARSSEA